MATIVSCSTTPVQSGDPPTPAPLILTDERDEYPLGLHMEILEDPAGELTIEDVTSREFSERFIPSQVEVPNYGYTDSVYWVRLPLRNDSQLSDHWLLEVGYANMHFVDLYSPSADGDGFEVKQTGAMRPLETRDVVNPHIVFNLTIPNQSEQTLYLRFQNNDSMNFLLALWKPVAFFAISGQNQMLQGVFLGVMLGLLAYNLFLLLSIREAGYLYLVLLIGSLIAYELSQTSVLEVYVAPNLYQVKQYFLISAIVVLFVSLILFIDTFLLAKTLFPTIHRINIVLVGTWAVLAILNFLVSYHIMAMVVIPLEVVTLVAVAASVLVAWHQDIRAIRFLLIALLGLVTGILLLILTLTGFISSNIFVENLYRFAFAWMAIGWSLALADRINLLQSEKEKANLELQTSETRYRQLVETMNDGLVVTDEQGRFTYVNNRISEMLGYSNDSLIGHSVTEFLEEDNQQILVNQLAKRKIGSSDPYELTWLKEDGSKKITHISPVPLFEIGGRYKGSFAVITDITERVLAGRLLEQRVNKRTQELTTLLEISHDIISTQDLAVVLNRILERLKAVLDYHQLTILAEQQGIWTILAQDCPCVSEDQIPVELTSWEVQALVKDFASGEPILIKNANLDEITTDGFGTTMTRLSKGCDANLRCWLGVPLIEQGSILGALVVGCEQADVSEDQLKIILAAANQVAIVIENNHLYQQIRDAVMVDERNRLARELHDSVTQTLFTASVLAEATPRIWEKNKDLAIQNLDNLSLLIRGALAEMRSMLIELRSGELGDQSLNQLLNTLGEAIQARIHAQISMSFMEIPELPPDVTLAFYRIAREALNNVLVHADAARVDISLIKENGRIELQIQDDGRGFDPGAIPTGHLGIRIMEEHAAEIGGHLRILSEPDRGTDVVFTWSGKPGEPDE